MLYFYLKSMADPIEPALPSPSSFCKSFLLLFSLVFLSYFKGYQTTDFGSGRIY